MPYLGTRIKHNDSYVTIRLHGPLDLYTLDFELLKDTARSALSNLTQFSLSDQDLMNKLAESLCKTYCDGNQLLYVQVEMLDNETQYINGATAENIKY